VPKKLPQFTFIDPFTIHIFSEFLLKIASLYISGF